MAGAWFSAAALLALVAVLLVVQAAVFAIASFGIALHWSCLIVAAVVAVLAIAFFFKGRSDAREEVTPTRTLNQIQRDISTVKERLT
jgi:membrane protein implicated in regulation of membrane protease activity